MAKAKPIKQRRRGADLENAILEDAWAELEANGYARFTLEGVASRSGTSRPVLARRWDSRFALAVAAVRQQMAQYPLEVEDRGDVRTELLEYLQRASSRASLIAVILSLLSGENADDPSSTPLKRSDALTGGEDRVLAAILQRASERGEIDGKKLIPAVETLLRDLFRYYVMMNLSAPPPALRKTWVDAILLPLVRKG